MPHMVIVLFTAKTPLAKYFYKLFLTNVTFWNHAVPCSNYMGLEEIRFYVKSKWMVFLCSPEQPCHRCNCNSFLCQTSLDNDINKFLNSLDRMTLCLAVLHRFLKLRGSKSCSFYFFSQKQEKSEVWNP